MSFFGVFVKIHRVFVKNSWRRGWVGVIFTALFYHVNVFNDGF